MAISKAVLSGLTLSTIISTLIPTLISTILFTTGCTANSSNSDTSSKSAQRYTIKEVGSATLLMDSKTGLTWTNSSQGCKPLFGEDPAKTLKTATSFCADLSFGGFSDWRLSSVKEMTELETQTDANGFSLYYKNPVCARVLALKSANTLTSISTTNKAPAGRDVGNKYPAGTRCVRS